MLDEAPTLAAGAARVAPRAPLAGGDGAPPGLGGAAAFFRRLDQVFGRRFLCFLGLTYLGLKGVALALVQAALLPYLQGMRVSGSVYQLASMVAMIPWSMKGAVGTLSDCLPLGRYHKRGYLLLSSASGCIGLCALAALPVNLVGSCGAWSVAGLFCLVHLQLSTFDLLCEGKYSEMMREERAGSEVVTLVWLCINVGGVAGALMVGASVDASGPRPLLAASLPLALLAAWRTWRGDLPEEPARSWASLRLKAASEPRLFRLALGMAAGGLAIALSAAFLPSNLRAVVAVVTSGVLVAYSFRALPRTLAKSNFYMFLISVAYLDLSGPLAYFYTGTASCIEDAPHFSYSYYLAVSNLVGCAGAALGAVLFRYMQHWSFRRAFVLTSAVQAVASGFDLLIIQRWNIAIGLSDEAAYLFGDAACQSVAVQMALMPGAVLTSRLCPRGAEATVYAILAGFQNFGQAVSSILGVRLCDALGLVASRDGPCDFRRLPLLLVLAHAVLPMACVPLTFWLVPAERVDDDDAFEAASPAPSFRSPASSPGNSPAGSPCKTWAPDADDGPCVEYSMMEDSGRNL